MFQDLFVVINVGGFGSGPDKPLAFLVSEQCYEDKPQHDGERHSPQVEHGLRWTIIMQDAGIIRIFWVIAYAYRLVLFIRKAVFYLLTDGFLFAFPSFEVKNDKGGCIVSAVSFALADMCDGGTGGDEIARIYFGKPHQCTKQYADGGNHTCYNQRTMPN